MKKIVFLALHLGFGGAEKAISNQANILCKYYDVEIISTYKLYSEPPFPLDERIKVTYLMPDLAPNREEFLAAIREKKPVKILSEGIKSVRILFMRTRTMKKAIQNLKADCIISSRILFNPLLHYCRPKTVTIAQEHNHHNGNEKYIRQMCKSVRNLDYFMPVSRELTDFYAGRLNDQHVKCVYIPHNLDSWPETCAALENYSIISVGRLSPEKGFADLVDIFHDLHQNNPQWKLHIVGDGEQRSLIEQKIRDYQLEKSVILHGFQQKPQVNKLLHQSSIYAMTSYTESFGIVLIEAQSHGIPCVAFASAQGAKEIIHDGVDGRLIADRSRQDYTKALQELISSPKLRKQWGESGRKNSEKYKEENVALEYHAFFEKILK